MTCTAEDMLPLAEACDFTTGSFQREYNGRLNKWDDAEYILSTFNGIHEGSGLIEGRLSVAASILRLYDDPDLRRAMGARGREFSRDFTADAMAAKYLDLYKQATGIDP